MDFFRILWIPYHDCAKNKKARNKLAHSFLDKHDNYVCCESNLNILPMPQVNSCLGIQKELTTIRYFIAITNYLAIL